MNTLENIFSDLVKNGFKVSTDTRKDLKGSVFFALKGESFDGNKFVKKALKSGAVIAITDNPKIKGRNIYVVKNVLKTLQEVATKYREKFGIPIIVIGGSNGKTTSKELVRDVLKIKYKVHATEGSLNNHIGVPLSILSMKKDTEIGVFEIGANHPKEHLKLLEIIKPTYVVVTNNGMDHLEGFGSVKGARKANKEIYDFALQNKSVVFVNKNHKDLIKDSGINTKILYPRYKVRNTNESPLVLIHNKKKYKTQMTGSYNMENIDLAIAIGNNFKIKTDEALLAISKYTPTSKRSQILIKNKIKFIVDCYNANPTSMKLSLESFNKSTKGHRGVVFGEMLELGKYSKIEHEKVLKYVLSKKMDRIILVGKAFRKVVKKNNKNLVWFPDSNSAKVWFWNQNFRGYTFLLKGSRGIKIENIIQ